MIIACQGNSSFAAKDSVESLIGLKEKQHLKLIIKWVNQLQLLLKFNDKGSPNFDSIGNA